MSRSLASLKAVIIHFLEDALVTAATFYVDHSIPGKHILYISYTLIYEKLTGADSHVQDCVLIVSSH